MLSRTGGIAFVEAWQHALVECALTRVKNKRPHRIRLILIERCIANLIQCRLHLQAQITLKQLCGLFS